MKRLLLLSVLFINAATAQIQYEPVLRLRAGERVEKYLSCWWLTDKNEIASLVIRQADGKLSAIENGVLRRDLTQDQVLMRANCDKLNPYKTPHDSHVRFASLQTGGQWVIHSTAERSNTYDKILFMRENEQHFIAVVSSMKSGVERFYYLDNTGRKELLEGRPQHFYTNSQLTKAAIVFMDAGTPQPDAISKLPRAQQVALFEQINKSSAKKRVWISDGQTFEVDKKSRLSFDASGRHFIEASPSGVFYMDGRQYNKNVSGGGTIIFSNEAGDNWAYFYEIYLTFSDNTTIKDAINPYLTRADGAEYLNWYKVEEEDGISVVKRGKKRL